VKQATSKRTIRQFIAPLVLMTLCVVWGMTQWEVHRLEKELHSLAQSKIEELRPPGKGLKDFMGRIAAEVVVAKPYLVYGVPTGKISVYVEHPGTIGEPKIEGYEFFYERRPDASWKQTESGRCVSEQCSKDGARVLDAFDENR
jgi:hypothetical protein